MKRKFCLITHKIKAFNLQEMLIVLALIGILLLIALPNFLPLITQAKGQEAKIQLKYIYNLQTQYRYLHSKYANDFTSIDYELPKTINENGNSNYNYQIVASSANSFKAIATAITDFDGDGILNVWEITENGNPTQTVKD